MWHAFIIIAISFDRSRCYPSIDLHKLHHSTMRIDLWTPQAKCHLFGHVFSWQTWYLAGQRNMAPAPNTSDWPQYSSATVVSACCLPVKATRGRQLWRGDIISFYRKAYHQCLVWGRSLNLRDVSRWNKRHVANVPLEFITPYVPQIHWICVR